MIKRITKTDAACIRLSVLQVVYYLIQVKKAFKKLPLYFFTLYFPFTVFLLTSYSEDYQLFSYNKTDSVRKTKSVYCL